MKKHVMIVDDSPIQEIQLRTLLEGSDYKVTAYCRNGEEALATYGVVKPDVVTMDIVMPGMDGLETTRALLGDHPDARVVIVSSLACDETFEEARAVGARDFLDKPVDRDSLLAALDRALERKSGTDPNS